MFPEFKTRRAIRIALIVIFIAFIVAGYADLTAPMPAT